MPTGYTASVQDGTVTTLPDFTMRCARAMGALIMMRDSATDAEVPERFEPSDHSVKAKRKAEARIVELREMSEEEKVAAWRDARTEAERYRTEYQEKKVADRLRYNDMLALVRGWEPPTADHVGLKTFMVEQLTGSVDFDCGGDYLPDVPTYDLQDWWQEQISKARRDVEYHTVEDRKERERTESRNRWVSELRASL